MAIILKNENSPRTHQKFFPPTTNAAWVQFIRPKSAQAQAKPKLKIVYFHFCF